ncbi:MAG: hypothetical protein AAGC92_10875 [Pseudomonadota bacterium]
MTAISRDDLAAAVELEIVTAEQASRLEALTQSRSGLRTHLDDEPFEFFQGFSQIFFALGIILFFGGATFSARLYFPVNVPIVFYFSFIFIAFLLAEFVVRRKRMQLPGIALIAFLTFFSLQLTLPPGFREAFGAALLLLFYLRHRLPAALFGVGAMLLIASLVWVTDDPVPFSAGTAVLFDLGTNPLAAMVTLGVGLTAFGVAMAYDLRDPHRVSRLSACAFWLHLLAAPAIVNTLAFTVYEMEGAVSYLLLSLTLLLVTLVALAIDRRSFLTAGLVYLGLLLATLLGQFGSVGSALVICLLGAIVLLVAAGWQRLRARLLARLRWLPWVDRLPPVEIRQ